DDVRGDLVRARPCEPPLSERLHRRGLLERRAFPLRQRRRSRAHAELVEEPARLAIPRDAQMPLRAGQPDVETPTLLREDAAPVPPAAAVRARRASPAPRRAAPGEPRARARLPPPGRAGRAAPSAAGERRRAPAATRPGTGSRRRGRPPRTRSSARWCARAP